MDIFGHTCIPRIISLDYTGTQFEIYNKISRNYNYSFLFESLTGPEELSETSIMGFDPEYIVKGYYDKITIQSRDGKIETIVTNDPLLEIKKLVKKTEDQTYRYLGGAVGVINYDAIRLWENIPTRHENEEPIMEFGIYTDGILVDNKEGKTLYFYYDENRINKIENLETEFEEFTISEISSSINDSQFDELVEKAKLLKTNKYVLKEQIHAGGRGKAGGIKIVSGVNELKNHAKKMFGKKLVTHQTGPKGREIKRLYMEETCDISKEFYLSCLVDRSSSKIVFVSSEEGGVNIEDVAKKNPKKIITTKKN